MHLGDYAIALDPRLIAVLKNSAQKTAAESLSPDSFVENLIISIGEKNRYLKEMIVFQTAAVTEKESLIKRLCKEIASL